MKRNANPPSSQRPGFYSILLFTATARELRLPVYGRPRSGPQYSLPQQPLSGEGGVDNVRHGPACGAAGGVSQRFGKRMCAGPILITVCGKAIRFRPSFRQGNELPAAETNRSGG